METIPYPNVILEELARLLNLWAENDWAQTTQDTLAAWAETSVSRTPRPPVPSAGLHLLERLAFTQSQTQDLVVPDSTVVRAFGPVPYLDAYSPSLATLIFERLYALPEFANELASVLTYVRFDRTNLSLDWRIVKRDDQANIGWEWLQQLGLARHDGNTLTLHESLSAFVADTPVSRRRMSQQELDERLEARKQRSELAEEFVLQLEKERLAAAGADEYLDGVIRVSIEDVEAGYDIQSYETNGQQRKIEVKSSVGPRRFFVFTANEMETAREMEDIYWLAWVSNSERLPDGPCGITWFRNPILILESDDSPWAMTASQMTVSIVSDDSSFVCEDAQ